MIKYLTTHGNSLALVIEKGVLDILGISRKTPLKIATDGNSLIVSPMRDAGRDKKFRRALREVNQRHAKTLKTLSE